MKKLIYLMFACAAHSAQGQERCGTMHYADQLRHNDPAYEQRMESTETMIRNWIAANHPNQQKQFPLIEGFTPTGNIEVDNKNYAVAKQQYYVADKPQRTLDARYEELKAEKRRKNSFQTKTSN